MKIKFIKLFLLVLLIESCTVVKETHKEVFEETKPAERIWGIDISHYQEIFDWNKLLQQEPGFIFLKASEGSTIQDQKYTEYYKMIRKLNIPVGSYHFFTYGSSGKDQAKNFLSIARYQHGDLPLVLDAEFAKKMPDREQIKKHLMDFMKVINDKTGRYPIIYCAYKYYLVYLKDNLPSECKLWIVDYRSNPNCDWIFWQTTEKYRAGGIKGYVDFNIFYGSKKDLKNLMY